MRMLFLLSALTMAAFSAPAIAITGGPGFTGCFQYGPATVTCNNTGVGINTGGFHYGSVLNLSTAHFSSHVTAGSIAGTYVLQDNSCMTYAPVGSKITVQADGQTVAYGQTFDYGGQAAFQAFETLAVGHNVLANGSFDDFIVESDGAYSADGNQFDYVETEEPSASNGNHKSVMLLLQFVRNDNKLTLYRDQGTPQTCVFTVSE